MVRRAGNPLSLRLDLRSPACSVLWRFALPLILLDVLTQANVYVDRTMASLLEPGKVAVLGWSAAMKDFLSGTLIASLLLVFLPHFSQQAARGAKDDLRRSAALMVRYAAITLLPVSALLCVCCPPVFQHLDIGRLDAAAARSLAFCLAAYGLGLFADLASTSLYQALMALGKLRALLLLAVLANFLPNLLFNLLLIGPLGEVGLALSTSLVGYCTLFANAYVFRRCVGAHEEAQSIRAILGALSATAASALAGVAAFAAVRSVWTSTSWGDLAAASAAAAATCTLYAFLMLVFPGSDDARRAARLVRDQLLATAGRFGR
jgi:putative peptidoglycan lipid II flippase